MRTCLLIAAALLAASAGPAVADTSEPLPPPFPQDRLGPSASVAVGAGYSAFQAESGGVCVLAMADLGWFVTDRVALLIGATLMTRPGITPIHQTMLRLGVEYRAAARHYFRLTAGRSSVGRERDVDEPGDDIHQLGTGEGFLLVAGVPAVFWRYGELSFQVDLGGAYHHGDNTESDYAAFVTTSLELAFR